MRARDISLAILRSREKYKNNDVKGAVADLHLFQYDIREHSFGPLRFSYSELFALSINVRKYGTDDKFDSTYEEHYLQTFERAIRQSFAKKDLQLELSDILNELRALEDNFHGIVKSLYLDHEVSLERLRKEVIQKFVLFQQLYHLPAADKVVELLSIQNEYEGEVDFKLMENLGRYFPLIYKDISAFNRLDRPIIEDHEYEPYNF